MRVPSRLAANLTHDCGAKFQIAFEDVNEPYMCPGCGVTERIGETTMSTLMRDFGRALIELERQRSLGERDMRIILDCHTGVISHREGADG